MRYMRMEDLEGESGMSRWTIMRAIKEEKLHGGQNKKNGPWRVDEACFHAWMRGDQCEHRAKEAA